MHISLAKRAAAMAVAFSIITSLAMTGSPAMAESVTLRDDAPSRYTVQEGDTLWGIAERFMSDPWRWPAIWKVNEQIANPHLIFPGDVIVVTYDGNGNPSLKVLRNQRFTGKTMKLSPGIYVDPNAKAITTIPPNVIQPFLTQPLLVGENELETAGYVTVGVEDNIILGKHQQFYARGVPASDQDVYQVFRPGRALKDPDTKDVLGHEAIYVGDARMLRRTDDVSKLEATRSPEEITPGDRLIPAPDTSALPYYFPAPPDTDIEGKIIHAHNGIREFGPYNVVAVNLGENDGIKTGTVLRIERGERKHRDPITREMYTLPREDTGLLMVFRTFDRVSYGLVMKATRAVHINDFVTTP